MKQWLPQRCPLAMIYLGWAFYAAFFVGLIVTSEFLAAVGWLIGYPLILLAYVRAFPRISALMGYGSVSDVPAEDSRHVRAARVTLYTARGCPFCPIVHRRLEKLKSSLGFEIDVVDLTLRPDRVAGAGIKSVPVVEAGGRRLSGNATSRQLALLVGNSAEG